MTAVFWRCPVDEDFKMLLRVRYGECDAQRVVFNARYGDYVDIAMTEFMRCLFGGYTAMVEEGVDNQVVRLEIDWTTPAKYDDVIAISVAAERVGNTSFTLKLNFTDFATKRKIATAEITYVLVSAASYTKISIPDNMREKLTRGAPNVVINHAGV